MRPGRKDRYPAISTKAATIDLSVGALSLPPVRSAWFTRPRYLLRNPGKSKIIQPERPWCVPISTITCGLLDRMRGTHCRI